MSGAMDHTPSCSADANGLVCICRRPVSEELRETMARTIFDVANPVGDVFPDYWPRMAEEVREKYRKMADTLLSGPLAPLLAAQAVVERVEALAVNPDVCSDYWGAVSVSALRRALDGTS